MMFRSLVDRGVIKRRNNGLTPDYPLSPLLEGYQCARQDEHISYGNLGVVVPPFGCSFSSVREQQNVIAVANEDGVLSLYNTESRQHPILKEWMAHDNAIFDVAWVPGEASLVTASGDQSARLWDVKSGELMGTFKGHQCSLKSVAFSKQEKAVFCTGGRDGNIMLWDTRCSKKDGFYRQVKQISGAHNRNKQDLAKTPKSKKRVQGQRVADNQQSVTVVLFRDEHTLISSGAVDRTIKMWDLRKSYTAYHHEPVPLQVYLYPGSSTRKLGFSGLVLDSTCSNLFANCTDDNIYMFNVNGLKSTPVAAFSGHRNSSFYVKSSVSPDDQFLVSGSSDHHAYIWKISNPTQPPMMLQGHNQEVTSVQWCPTDFTKIVSCSDDNTIRVWRLNRGEDGERSTVGQANLVGWACPKEKSSSPAAPSPAALSRCEVTPSKSHPHPRHGPPSTDSLGPMSSPQPAACAHSTGDLPLPSSTSQTPSPSPKPFTPPRKPPSSSFSTSSSTIRQWLSRTPGSPAADPLTPPLRKVLSPCPQSPQQQQQQQHQSSPQQRHGQQVSVPSPPERKAKRRLETTDGGACCRDAEGACGCVSELNPVTKRGRMQVCCGEGERGGPAGAGTQRRERSGGEESADRPLSLELVEGSRQRLLGATQQQHSEADKENRSSPSASGWLVAMGRSRGQQRGPQSTLSPKSPKSPGVGKRQEKRAPASPMICSPQSMRKISSYFHKRTPE
ncbi:denticleless protein homolog [Engraulis encrasicolus]|uniref:denticleless protein homolog n=1 Tax=Engraulis encrasicolus TaxID=184585 RepID=UPI002FD2DB05